MSQKTTQDIKPLVNLPPGYHIEQGFPDPSTLQEAFQLFQQAISDEPTKNLDDFKDQTVALLRYGDLPCGSQRACDALKLFLERTYQRQIDPETLIVSAGATHGLFWLLTLVFNQRTAPARVYMEEPTYFCALRMFRNNNMQMLSIPTTVRVDAENVTRHVDFQKLEEVMQKNGAADESKKKFEMYRGGMIYMVPEHHNPTGTSLPASDRQAVIKLAKKYDCLIVCDDVYQLLNFPINENDKDNNTGLITLDAKNDKIVDELKFPKPTCLFGEQEEYREYIVSNASFSKLLAPGIRLGWMEAPKKLVEFIYASGVFYSGGCPNSATAGLLLTAITQQRREQFERHVKRYALRLGQRMQVIQQVLHQRLHTDTTSSQSVDELCRLIRWTKPRGGFFFSIVLPPPPRSRLPATFVEHELRPTLVENKVFVHHGAAFSAGSLPEDGQQQLRNEKDQHTDTCDATFLCTYMMRLSVAYIGSVKEAREAAEILCPILRQMLQTYC